MNDLPLSFYVKSIEHQLEDNKTRLAEIFSMTQDRRKVQNLLEIIANSEGELLFLLSTLQEEMKKRQAKPFWKFWK